MLIIIKMSNAGQGQQQISFNNLTTCPKCNGFFQNNGFIGSFQLMQFWTSLVFLELKPTKSSTVWSLGAKSLKLVRFVLVLQSAFFEELVIVALGSLSKKSSVANF